MTPEQLIARIRAKGAPAVANEIGNFFVIGIRDGIDLTRWAVHARHGMFAFDLTPGPPPVATPLRAEREALDRRRAELLARSYHEAEARQERESAQNRINLIDRLLREGAEPPAQAETLPLATILCVNAPEAERGRFAAQLPAPDDPDYRPITLLMREQAFTATPF